MITSASMSSGSWFRKAIIQVFLEVYENAIVKVREGKASVWYDEWLNNEPLGASTNMVNHSKLKIQDVWDLNG